MQLDETVNVFPVDLEIDPAEGEFDAVLKLSFLLSEIVLDQETAQQLLPILEHFIKTGELPDAR